MDKTFKAKIKTIKTVFTTVSGKRLPATAVTIILPDARHEDIMRLAYMASLLDLRIGFSGSRSETTKAEVDHLSFDLPEETEAEMARE